MQDLKVSSLGYDPRIRLPKRRVLPITPKGNKLAPRAGFEPTAIVLTGLRSTVELSRNKFLISLSKFIFYFSKTFVFRDSLFREFNLLVVTKVFFFVYWSWSISFS